MILKEYKSSTSNLSTHCSKNHQFEFFQPEKARLPDGQVSRTRLLKWENLFLDTILSGFKFLILLLCIAILVLSCAEKKKEIPFSEVINKSAVEYASGFSIEHNSEYTVVKVLEPWPGASKAYTYAFIPQEKLASITYPKDAYDAVIAIPIKDFVITSTTHIPAVEALGGLNKVVGFPNTKYISSMPARKLIAERKIKELGTNESLNTEMVLELAPDLIVGFGINNQNSTYEVIQKANIPVVFNGDWNEKTPLGKAEWIKFFGVLLNKEKEADSIFSNIVSEYERVRTLSVKATHRPTVLSGALYKDVWYLPAGESWAAQFLADANVNYLWQESKGTGSLSLSLESVLEKGQNADFWVSPSQFTSYMEMEESNLHYQQFKAFRDKKVFTFSATKGPTGGLLFYELAPQRPDLVLKDMVHIFHPDLLPNHSPYFFTPLQ
ncbi:ABC transporter substrate-binding protein [uncultured Croceitalea sp.]|uniref:ABC transporter substrate-binding protein n=1 Tax=uncultured Croceitalea sp. TaxID=1798908 RepID=UPI0033057EC9